jgi:hypothetical protein
MSYTTITQQLQSCLGSASIFTHGTAQVSIGDEKIYSRGYTPVAVIGLEPGLRHIRETFKGGHVHEWHVLLTVGAQWKDAASGPVQLNAAWQAVFDQIDTHPFLGLGANGGIRDAFVTDADFQPIVMEYGTIKFAKVRLSVAIQEEVNVQEVE